MPPGDDNCEGSVVKGHDKRFWTIRAMDQIGPAMEEISALISCEECPSPQVADLSVAASEAVANALKHGGLDRPEKEIRVGFTRDCNRVELWIRDSGPGFDPSRIQDPTSDEFMDQLNDSNRKPGGWGLHLIKQMVDSVSWNQTGNEIRLVKIFTPECDTPPRGQ